jgi:hypothetical protein
MRKRIAAVLFVGTVLLTPNLWAQDSPSIAFGLYYRCDQALESRADEIVEQVFVPIYDKQLAAGNISAYGWAAHVMGGAWRRLSYMIGTDMGAMMDARAAIIEDLQTNHASALGELTGICPSHDDYIWTTVASSQPTAQLGQDRPDAGMTTYYACNAARETRADEIVQQVIGPEIQRHIDMGHLNSWSWIEHTIGGRWRRALVLDAADHKTILTMRQAIISALERNSADEMEEFTQICGAHTDYLWDLMIAKSEN